MHVYLRRALGATVITGGIAVAGLALAGPASADASSTSGEHGLLSGNQSAVSAAVPVDVGGNQVVVLGDRNDSSHRSSGGSGDTTPHRASTSGQDGAGSGNQSAVQVRVPVTVTGNQVGVGGDDNTTSTQQPTRPESPEVAVRPERVTSGADGIGSGNQTLVDAQVPVDVCGNQVVVLGSGNANQCSSGAGSASPAGSATGGTTDGEDGLGSGNQTDLGINAPIDAAGNQVTVIGDDNTADSTTTNPAESGTGSSGDTTNGQDGLGSGNQTNPTVTAPIDTTGNQVTVIGDGNTATTTDRTDGSTGGGSGDNGGDTTGEGGTGSGNQTSPVIIAPVDAGGNQVVVIGDGNSSETEPTTEGGATPAPGTGPTPGTPGDGGTTSPAVPTVPTSPTSPAQRPQLPDLAQAGPSLTTASVLPATGAAEHLLLGVGLGLVLLVSGLAVSLATRRTREDAWARDRAMRAILRS